MKREFGRLPNGDMAYLHTIHGGGLEAHITDLGATLHRLYVPDADGSLLSMEIKTSLADSFPFVNLLALFPREVYNKQKDRKEA